jgi:hypothetical protein
MLNLTRLHLGIAHESQFQGLGITANPSLNFRIDYVRPVSIDGIGLEMPN